jgi:8-oxo-dGTP diphosphatase
VTVYLVRHAQALTRCEWGQSDDIRPLTKKGIKQAAGLVAQLSEQPVKRILSSPSIRCRETVRPLAEEVGVEIEFHDALLEGARIDRALALLAEVALEHGDIVLCSHGDVIPDVLRRLRSRGMKLRDKPRWPKGSAWALEVDGRDFVEARYLPPAE